VSAFFVDKVRYNKKQAKTNNMKNKFSEGQIEKLRLNPCVFNCTTSSVNYTVEFKKRALELSDNGISAKEIWLRSDFDTSWWRKGYFRETIRDWKKIVAQKGIEGLIKSGGIQFDKGPSLNSSDKVKRLELQVKYLQAENDFLAKLRAKRAELNSGRVKNI
jgi:hypothetical protein